MLGALGQLAFLKRAQMDGLAAQLCVASDHGPVDEFLGALLFRTGFSLSVERPKKAFRDHLRLAEFAAEPFSVLQNPWQRVVKPGRR